MNFREYLQNRGSKYQEHAYFTLHLQLNTPSQLQSIDNTHTPFWSLYRSHSKYTCITT